MSSQGVERTPIKENATVKEYLFFPSGKRKTDEAAYRLLSGLPNVQVLVVPEGPLLKKWVLLPFVETEEGSRRHGMESIESFVQQELKQESQRSGKIPVEDKPPT